MSETAARMDTVQEIVDNLDGLEEIEQARTLAAALLVLGSTHLGSIMTEALVEMEEGELFDSYCGCRAAVVFDTTGGAEEEEEDSDEDAEEEEEDSDEG